MKTITIKETFDFAREYGYAIALYINGHLHDRYAAIDDYPELANIPLHNLTCASFSDGGIDYTIKLWNNPADID